MSSTVYLKTQAGMDVRLYAYAYREGVDENNMAQPARMIVGMSGGVDVSAGFLSPADVRTFAALLIEQASAAEGIAG